MKYLIACLLLCLWGAAPALAQQGVSKERFVVIKVMKDKTPKPRGDGWTWDDSKEMWVRETERRRLLPLVSPRVRGRGC